MPKNLILLIFCILSYLSNPSKQHTLNLIHADSLIFQNDTLEQRYERWSEMSRQRCANPLEHLDDIGGLPPYRAPIKESPQGLLLAEFQLGDPVTNQYTVIDIRSGFMWVVCDRSDFMPGNYSCLLSAYCLDMLCYDDACKDVPGGNFCPGSQLPEADDCLFTTNYMSKFLVDGFVVNDMSYFGGKDSKKELFFGCGNVNMEPSFGGTGVMGLSKDNASVASQFGSIFEYRIGDLYDPRFKYNMLVLGSDAELQGVWTPILDIPSKIYVRLKQIKVAGEVLNIDSTIFNVSISGGGTMMDTGAPHSYLHDDAYRVLRAKLSDSISGFDVPGKSDLDDFCRYDIKEIMVPEVIFVFDMGAELRLGFHNLFQRVAYDKHCLTIKASSTAFPDKKTSMIGILAQVSHVVGYDYNDMRVYFKYYEASS